MNIDRYHKLAIGVSLIGVTACLSGFYIIDTNPESGLTPAMWVCLVVVGTSAFLLEYFKDRSQTIG